MKLYKINYKVWNAFFPEVIRREVLSVGVDEEDAINKVKAVESLNAMDFKAEPIIEVFGHKIEVK